MDQKRGLISSEQYNLLKITAQALYGKRTTYQVENLPALIKEAKQQAVFPLTFSILAELGADRMKEKQFRDQILAKNLRIDFEHNELHHLMSENEIPYVIMKGSASAMYYPEPLLRTMGDVDFLIDEENLGKAGKALESVGFHAVEKNENECHIAYYREIGESTSVWEMHWEPNGIPKGNTGDLVRGYFSDIFETSVCVTMSENEYLVPDAFHHGLILLLHTATHLINTGVGLRHICDWAVFENSFTEDQFRNLFEKKLKAVGLWHFVQLLTQLSIQYLGADFRNWCGESSEEYLETLMSDILAGGNFGTKDSNRINQAKLLTNAEKGTVDNSNLLRQLFRTMNEKARIALPITKNIGVLLPIGWLYVGIRHMIRIFRRERPQIDVEEMVKGAVKRREIYKQFKLFEKE